MNFFPNTIEASFLSRPNRYTAWCECEGRKEKAYLPNPGRLEELLFPGSALHLEKASNPDRATRYTVVAVDRDGEPVMLHTHKTNDVAQHLLESHKVPGLEAARIVRREVPHGASRFDFLLEEDGREIFVEVKSCTLFGRRVAMFPDAVTARGTKHVRELAALAKEGRAGVILFVVHTTKARWFLPEFHRDPEFTRALISVKDKVRIIPLAVGWTPKLRLKSKPRLLTIPWRVLETEALDRGSYLIALRLEKDRRLSIGKLGEIGFSAGHYLYVGSAMSGLTKRIERHQRLRKKKFWHIDYFRSACRFLAAMPIRASDELECTIAKKVRTLASEEIDGFGSSDCDCPSHLFRMDRDPLDVPAFHDMLQYFRMDRLIE